MTGHEIIAIGLALLVEGSHWIKLRWDFSEDSAIRAWQLTNLIILISGTLIYLDTNIYVALPRLLSWLPPLLLPMQFIQIYGLHDSLPLNTFSVVAKHQRKRNQRLGITTPTYRLNFGHVYFVVTLVAATIGGGQANNLRWAFLPGLIVLTGWMLLSGSRSRPLALLAALAVAGGISLGGQQVIENFKDLYSGSPPPSSGFSPNATRTQIGIPGRLNQSPDIVWRLRAAERAAIPRLLRTASYNIYRAGRWEVRPESDRRFSDIDSRLYEGEPYFLVLPETDEKAQLRAVRKSLPRFQLRGAAIEKGPIPLPGDATSLLGFELDGMERNGFGSIRGSLKQPVIDGTVLWHGDTSTENPPIPTLDTEIHRQERGTLRKIASELGLDRQAPLETKLKIVHEWFLRNFTYTRKPMIIASPDRDGPTALTTFLETERSGHCEYFASAAALLLREAGIPTRYAVGYMAAEYDAKRREFSLRGTHLHAWTRVWDESKRSWIDFDTTPPSWIPAIDQIPTRTQRFNDWVKKLREDFYLWRNRPANRTAASVVMTAIALGIVSFIALRLWKSRRRLEQATLHRFDGTITRTPLNRLEKRARERLGPRPPGQPLAAWLAGLQPFLADPLPLREAIDLHQRLRFDPAPHAPDQNERLAELATRLESALKKGA